MAKKPKKQKSESSKQRILSYFLQNLGNVLESKQIQEASGGASEWARRVRELRNEDGYQILSHKDRDDLKPGQYLIETPKQLPAFKRDISKETRAYVLERNGYTCQMCGVAAGDPDPLGGTRTVRLTMGHVIEKMHGGTDDVNNLRALCSACNEGISNNAPQKPDQVRLLSQIRKATISDQQAVLNWLLQKYNLVASKKPDIT
jgi:hypothetical protein